MVMPDPLKTWEKLDELCARFRTPHIPEYELSYFRQLYGKEIDAARDAAEAAVAKKGSPEALTRLGRAKRLLGDLPGAAADFRRALDLAPGHAPALAWLGELDLRRPESLETLDRAVAADARLPMARLYRGAALLLGGRLTEALADFRLLEKLSSRCALGVLLSGLAHERLKNRLAAASCYRRAAKLDPVCSAAHLLLSRIAPTEKEAVRAFRDAYDVSPVLGFITLQIDRSLAVDARAYRRRIVKFAFEKPETVGAYYRREATQSHFSHFPAEDYGFVRRLAKRHPDLPWAHAFFGRASCYTPAGATEGVAHLTRAIRLAPHCGWVYAWRANAYRVLRKNDAALRDFAESLRRQPFYHRAFVWRGGLLRKLGRAQEALADLDRALVMDPFYSLTYYERSMARRALEDFPGAASDLDRAFALDHRYHWAFKTGGPPSAQELAAGVKDLDRAVRRWPSLASLRVWRAQLKAQQGDLSAAVLELEEACALDPQHAIARAWHGWVLLQAGRPEEAAARLEKAVALDGRFWIAYQWLAEARFRLGQLKQAQACLSLVLAAKPSTPWVHWMRAKFLMEAAANGGRERAAKEALRSLDLALKLDGKYPEAYLLSAQARLALGDDRRALAAAERCLEIAPNMGRALVLRAEIHRRAGRAAKAVADYKAALRDFPYLFNEEERARMEGLLG